MQTEEGETVGDKENQFEAQGGFGGGGAQQCDDAVQPVSIITEHTLLRFQQQPSKCKSNVNDRWCVHIKQNMCCVCGVSASHTHTYTHTFLLHFTSVRENKSPATDYRGHNIVLQLHEEIFTNIYRESFYKGSMLTN